MSQKLDRALSEDRSLVITWLNRGTLHLIATEDEPLLHALTTPQLRSASERRLRHSGISPMTAERGVSAVARALSDEPMARAHIRHMLEREGLPTAGQALADLLFRVMLDGYLFAGRSRMASMRSCWPATGWESARRSTATGRSPSCRYVLHGPAEERDLARWAQLPLRDARAGLEAIASQLDQRPGRWFSTSTATSPAPFTTAAATRTVRSTAGRLALWDSGTERSAGGCHRQSSSSDCAVNGRAAGTWTLRSGRVALELWDDQIQ